ncbi:MAG: ABC transporter ATP-binding protein [Actinomycetota bacterium]
MPALLIENVHKEFVRRDGTKVPAVDNISLRIEQGEFVVLLGPSGCGKTTLLRCVAGLEQPDSGTIVINGEPHYSSANRLNSPPDKRKLGMIFQSYALWPHMKVSQNVAYPLQVRKVPKSEIRDRVMNVLELAGIKELAEQYPGQLSGGQQQRVALARALVSNNGLVLFDEPLSNVDAKVREQLRFEILKMQAEIGFAAVYVTHDQDEAMELSDRIAVLNSGKISQLDRPEAIYDRPADRYVAKFVGATNEIEGVVKSIGADGMAVVTTEAGPVGGVIGQGGIAVGDTVCIIGRPENFVLGTTAPRADHNEWAGEVLTTMFMGDHRGAVVTVKGWGDVRVHFPSSTTSEIGDSVTVELPPKFARIYKPSEK